MDGLFRSDNKARLSSIATAIASWNWVWQKLDSIQGSKWSQLNFWKLCLRVKGEILPNRKTIGLLFYSEKLIQCCYLVHLINERTLKSNTDIHYHSDNIIKEIAGKINKLRRTWFTVSAYLHVCFLQIKYQLTGNIQIFQK